MLIREQLEVSKNAPPRCKMNSAQIDRSFIGAYASYFIELYYAK
jgi:hypothetical protein